MWLLDGSFVLSFILSPSNKRQRIQESKNLVIIKHLPHYIPVHLIQKHLLTHAEVLSAAVN